jgi:hypothetical protein
LSDGEIVQGEPQNGNKKKKLPLKDKILMGPLDKYQKYSKKNGVISCRSFSFEVPCAHPAGHRYYHPGDDAE